MTPVGWRTKTDRRRGVVMRRKVSVSLPADVIRVLEAECASQRRSLSNMVLVYLTTHAAIVPGVGTVEPGQRRVRKPKTPMQPPPLEPEPVPQRRRGREKTCAHSIPASMKCLVCDDE